MAAQGLNRFRRESYEEKESQPGGKVCRLRQHMKTGEQKGKTRRPQLENRLVPVAG